MFSLTISLGRPLGARLLLVGELVMVGLVKKKRERRWDVNQKICPIVHSCPGHGLAGAQE